MLSLYLNKGIITKVKLNQIFKDLINKEQEKVDEAVKVIAKVVYDNAEMLENLGQGFDTCQIFLHIVCLIIHYFYFSPPFGVLCAENLGAMDVILIGTWASGYVEQKCLYSSAFLDGGVSHAVGGIVVYFFNDNIQYLVTNIGNLLIGFAHGYA